KPTPQWILPRFIASDQQPLSHHRDRQHHRIKRHETHNGSDNCSPKIILFLHHDGISQIGSQPLESEKTQNEPKTEELSCAAPERTPNGRGLKTGWIHGCLLRHLPSFELSGEGFNRWMSIEV